ncbi:MAG: sigma-70 family RNA polymerase sigma factor [Clostridia bacterium]|nr:sigma-70 family RNA polymerase sigma factor [Clostridia bacterium]
MFLTVLMMLPPEGQDRFFLLWETVRENLVKYVRMKLNGVPTYKDCEDIVEDAFVRVMEQYERYHDRPDEEIKAILIRTCDNLCSNEKTRSRKIVTVSLSPDVDGDEINEASLSGEEVMTPEDLIISESNTEHIKEIIRSLPPIQRDILQMKILEEQSYPDIAKELMITESTARQRFKRAREDVIRKLKEEGYEHETDLS